MSARARLGRRSVESQHPRAARCRRRPCRSPAPAVTTDAEGDAVQRRQHGDAPRPRPAAVPTWWKSPIAPAGEPGAVERLISRRSATGLARQQPERLAVLAQLGQPRLEQRQAALARDLLDRHVVESQDAEVQPIGRRGGQCRPRPRTAIRTRSPGSRRPGACFRGRTRSSAPARTPPRRPRTRTDERRRTPGGCSPPAARVRREQNTSVIRWRSQRPRARRPAVAAERSGASGAGTVSMSTNSDGTGSLSHRRFRR